MWNGVPLSKKIPWYNQDQYDVQSVPSEGRSQEEQHQSQLDDGVVDWDQQLRTNLILNWPLWEEVIKVEQGTFI